MIHEVWWVTFSDMVLLEKWAVSLLHTQQFTSICLWSRSKVASSLRAPNSWYGWMVLIIEKTFTTCSMNWRWKSTKFDESHVKVWSRLISGHFLDGTVSIPLSDDSMCKLKYLQSSSMNWHITFMKIDQLHVGFSQSGHSGHFQEATSLGAPNPRNGWLNPSTYTQTYLQISSMNWCWKLRKFYGSHARIWARATSGHIPGTN